MDRVTWKWVEESLLPTVVIAARDAGVDTTRWALMPGPSGRALVTLTERKGVAKVHQRFGTAREAELALNAMRWAWEAVPARGESLA